MRAQVPLHAPLLIQIVKDPRARASCEDTASADLFDFRLFRAFRLRFGSLALRLQGGQVNQQCLGRHLRHHFGLELSDVDHVFGTWPLAREVLTGKRLLSRGQAKKLANFFKVPAKLFLLNIFH